MRSFRDLFDVLSKNSAFHLVTIASVSMLSFQIYYYFVRQNSVGPLGLSR